MIEKSDGILLKEDVAVTNTRRIAVKADIFVLGKMINLNLVVQKIFVIIKRTSAHILLLTRLGHYRCRLCCRLECR